MLATLTSPRKIVFHSCCLICLRHTAFALLVVVHFPPLQSWTDMRQPLTVEKQRSGYEYMEPVGRKNNADRESQNVVREDTASDCDGALSRFLSNVADFVDPRTARIIAFCHVSSKDEIDGSCIGQALYVHILYEWWCLIYGTVFLPVVVFSLLQDPSNSDLVYVGGIFHSNRCMFFCFFLRFLFMYLIRVRTRATWSLGEVLISDWCL